MDQKVQEWVDEIKKLSEIAITQPQSAYAAFTRSLSSHWTYLLRIIDPTRHSASELFQPLEDVICSSFIPALTGHCTPGNLIRDLLAFPASLGGLVLTNPVAIMFRTAFGFQTYLCSTGWAGCDSGQSIEQ